MDLKSFIEQNRELFTESQIESTLSNLIAHNSNGFYFPLDPKDIRKLIVLICIQLDRTIVSTVSRMGDFVFYTIADNKTMRLFSLQGSSVMQTWERLTDYLNLHQLSSKIKELVEFQAEDVEEYE